MGGEEEGGEVGAALRGVEEAHQVLGLAPVELEAEGEARVRGRALEAASGLEEGVGGGGHERNEKMQNVTR